MGTLNAALEWARRGFSVFPLRENTREPALGDDWTSLATKDEQAIRKLWLDPVLGIERDYNIGCMCNDMVVIDIDVKKGKDGYNQYLQMGGNFDTLVVRTTTGGYHCYFYGPDSSNSPLDSGVDVRSHNGYVVAPGSTIDGIPYQVVNDVQIAWIPPAIECRLRDPYERAATDSDFAADTEASIHAAIRFLETAPIAVEGQRGDERTFITAARLCREMALTPETAYSLMRDYWNPKCQPPWELEDLWQKVVNAANYGSADYGALTPEHLFGHLNMPPIPDIFEQSGSDWGNAYPANAIRPRDWIVPRMLLRKAVTLLLATGSVGKSSFSLALAAHLAIGKPYAGHTVNGATKSIVYNGEDDVEEQSRRLMALCLVYGFNYDEVKKEIMFISPRHVKLELVSNEFNKPVRNDAIINQLTAIASRNDVGLLILDPLVRIHRCDESDNGQMDVVMDTLTDIADKANISILALHHTSKGNARQEDRIGNMDIARGASAVVNAARIAYTLLNPSLDDAESYGFREDERHMFVRLDDAKMNMALASTTPTWFKRTSMKIEPSNDIVGVLEYTDIKRSVTHVRDRVAGILIETMNTMGAGAITLAQAISATRAGEPIMAAKKDAEIRQRLDDWFGTSGVVYNKVVDGNTLTIKLMIQRESADSDKRVLTMS
ncbi:hypothetical protein EKK58_09085 [Candidatus Dependentiae bacterium]|nr:MAG: hypothetical protein EKK58_09085 [Candidatus Dependentiae bacterium]